MEIISSWTPLTAFSLAESDRGLLLEQDKQTDIATAIMNLVFIGFGF